MGRSASLALILAVLWVMLSGYLDQPLLLALGAISVAFVVFIAHRLDVVDHEGHPIHLSPRVLAYWPWLFKQIVLSSVAVAKVILSPRMPIHPTVFTVRALQRTDVGRVTLGNSITLTPGTVTIALDGDLLTVYALTREAASGWEDSEMNRRVARIEGGP